MPAYNEKDRLGKTLSETFLFLDSWASKIGWTYEVIIFFILFIYIYILLYIFFFYFYQILLVDDGSADNTTQIAFDYKKKLDNQEKLAVLQLPKNQGKGGAIKSAIPWAKGEAILILDADGATDISQALPSFLSEWIKQTNQEKGTSYTLDSIPSPSQLSSLIIIGSRAHLAEKSKAIRSFLRTFLMKGFHFIVNFLTPTDIQDTQCGCKLFSAPLARELFNNLHLYRWAFDIEVLYVAKQLSFNMVEIPVKWQEIEGSKLISKKLDVITTSLTMARDIFSVRFAYMFSFWKISSIGQIIKKDKEL